MKNIHVLPTDKPSKLFWNFNKISLGIFENIRQGKLVNNRHIYITSDEEIKEEDWCLHNGILKRVLRIKNAGAIIIFNVGNGSIYGHKFKNAKKIILTTDQDLIKDGVQAIDDEFLQWFVKNPSCESVKVDLLKRGIYDEYKYKIIIPKEEPKQETLEEAAYKLFSTMPSEISTSTAKSKALKLAKWQQERSYSEEDMISFSNFKNSNLMRHSDSKGFYLGDKKVFDLWVEQFKKK